MKMMIIFHISIQLTVLISYIIIARLTFLKLIEINVKSFSYFAAKNKSHYFEKFPEWFKNCKKYLVCPNHELHYCALRSRSICYV